MDKKEEKFKFVNMDDIELDNIADNVEIVSSPDVVNVDKFEDNEKFAEEVNVDSTKIEDEEINSDDIKEEKEEVQDDDDLDEVESKTHIGYGTRVIVMVIFIIILFGGACLLMLKVYNDKQTTISYKETSNSSYQVCLKGEDSSCIDEGNLYYSLLIKSINTTFEYNIDFEESTQYNLNYYITATTKIYDKDNTSKVLYHNEEYLVNKTTISDNRNNIGIYKTVTYDYIDDNKYVVDYRNVYSNEYIADTEIALYLYDSENEKATKVSSVTVPLNRSGFEITKYNINKPDQKLNTISSSWDNTSITCAAIASVLIIISLILVYRLTHLVLRVTNNRSKYQSRLMQILRDYDSIIVIARDGYETNIERKVVKLDNFDKLLDIKSNLNKPIIFSKINDVKSEFIVEDDDILYKFVLKDE